MTTQQIFDDYGRCIPTGLKNSVNDQTRRYFLCDQPKIDFDEIYGRLSGVLAVEDGFTVDDFKARAQQIISGLQASEETKNITNGVYVPFFVPRDKEFSDIGAAMEETYLPAVGQAYTQKLPEYEFKIGRASCRERV